jgi:hypothetical protein
MSEIDDADLNTVLARAYPQEFAILRHEGGTGIMRIGAKEVLRNPVLARGTVAPRVLAHYRMASGAFDIERAATDLGTYPPVAARIEELRAQNAEADR